MKYNINITDLDVGFNGRNILNKVNLKIEPGESLAIIGESGSGKSVLMKSIIGLISPQSGTVKINGKNIDNNKNILKNFGILFQNSALFDSLNVWENISFNFTKRFNYNKKQAKILAINKLKMVGLSDDIINMYPSELSGGMKKRVALARAIANNPHVIILDEPTSGLDPIMSDIVNDIVVKFNNELKLTAITITHDLHSAFKIAQNIAVLYKGSIIFCDNIQKIKQSKNEYIRQFIKHAI